MMSASVQTSPAPTSPAAPITKAAAEPFLLLLCLILLGNAVDGKGFAFLFLGEFAIPLGIIVLLRTRGWAPLFDIPAIFILLPLVIWCAIRTLPYLSEYPIDA